MVTVNYAIAMHEAAIEIQKLEDSLHKKLLEFSENYPQLAFETLAYREKAEDLYCGDDGFEKIFNRTEFIAQQAIRVQSQFVEQAKIEAGTKEVLDVVA
jgi:hypothetical protein